jgi:hypothetical protein
VDCSPVRKLAVPMGVVSVNMQGGCSSSDNSDGDEGEDEGEGSTSDSEDEAN